MRMSLSNQVQSLAQQRPEVCARVLYILLVAWKRERFSLEVGRCHQCEGGIRRLGLCLCLATKCRIALLCKGPNVYAPGTGETHDDVCVI